MSAGENSDLIDAIFWGAGEPQPCRAGDNINIVFEPEIHEWYGEHVQLICKDIRVDKKRIITRDFWQTCIAKSGVYYGNLAWQKTLSGS